MDNLNIKPDRYGVVIVAARSKIDENRQSAETGKIGNNDKGAEDIQDLEYLVIYRSELVIAPGALCFPGGGIELGETPQEAAIREFREEVGLEIKLSAPVWNSITPWNVALDWFSARLAFPGQIPRPDRREVASVDWMTLDEIMQNEKLLKSNLPFLEGVRKGSILLNLPDL